jgi:hypothetical protein
MPDGSQHTAVAREILVRYLDAWVPAALHGARRVTYASDGSLDDARAALRVFGEFVDRLRGRELAMVLATSEERDAREWTRELDGLHRELGAPTELKVRVAAGPLAAVLGDRRRAGPTLLYLNGTGPATPANEVARLVAGGAAELLLAVHPRTEGQPAGALAAGYRDAVRAAGLSATLLAELVDHGGDSHLLLFATPAVKHLEKFKDELWSVDEFAGVRYRDPFDTGRTLLDISLTPDLGPLRRSVLAQLAGQRRTVAQLRQWSLEETLYRPADLNRALTGLLHSAAIGREPDKGRLTADTLIWAS